LFVDASGRVLIGISSGITAPDTDGVNRIPRLQGAANTFEGSFWNNAFFGTASGAATIQFTRSNDTTIGGHVAPSSGQRIGTLQWSASDGSQYIRAAQISASVDGVTGQTAGTFVVGTEYRILTTGTTDFTLIGAADSNPGTIFTATGAGTGTGTAIRTAGDMPGRLTFATTPDNTGVPVERMRIDASGRIGFGSSTLGGTGGVHRFAGSVTGNASANGTLYSYTLQPDANSAPSAVSTSTATASNSGTPYTITNVRHFVAAQGAFNVDSTVTFQTGFTATASLTGATTNFGFRGQIPAATDRWNVFMDGTAANYFVGQVQLATGTNVLPSLSAFGDTDTGLFFPAANTVGLVTNGTEGFRITSDQVRVYTQPAPAEVNATATLTVANLKAGIITSTSAAATDMTLPTGTNSQGGFTAPYDNMAFEWSVINTGPSLVTVLANTAHTLEGSGAVAAGTSARFASRRTAANTFVTYRLS
jgi:hypothetical protein